MVMMMMMMMMVVFVLCPMHLSRSSPGPTLLTREDLNVLFFLQGPMCLMSCLLAMVFPSAPSPLSSVPFLP